MNINPAPQGESGAGGWEESEHQPPPGGTRLQGSSETDLSRRRGKRKKKKSSVSVEQVKTTMTQEEQLQKRGETAGSFLPSSFPESDLPNGGDESRPTRSRSALDETHHPQPLAALHVWHVLGSLNGSCSVPAVPSSGDRLECRKSKEGSKAQWYRGSLTALPRPPTHRLLPASHSSFSLNIC